MMRWRQPPYPALPHRHVTGPRDAGQGLVVLWRLPAAEKGLSTSPAGPMDNPFAFPTERDARAAALRSRCGGAGSPRRSPACGKRFFIKEPSPSPPAMAGGGSRPRPGSKASRRSVGLRSECLCFRQRARLLIFPLPLWYAASHRLWILRHRLCPLPFLVTRPSSPANWKRP